MHEQPRSQTDPTLLYTQRLISCTNSSGPFEPVCARYIRQKVYLSRQGRHSSKTTQPVQKHLTCKSYCICDYVIISERHVNSCDILEQCMQSEVFHSRRRLPIIKYSHTMHYVITFIQQDGFTPLEGIFKQLRLTGKSAVVRFRRQNVETSDSSYIYLCSSSPQTTCRRSKGKSNV